MNVHFGGVAVNVGEFSSDVGDVAVAVAVAAAVVDGLRVVAAVTLDVQLHESEIEDVAGAGDVVALQLMVLVHHLRFPHPCWRFCLIEHRGDFTFIFFFFANL